MSRAARIALAVVALLGALGLGVIALSEAGEVVVLLTTDEQGEGYQTRLWIVDMDGAQWLRAGQARSGWYARLRTRPEVGLERGERSDRYVAVPVPEASERVDAAMAEKYGLADRIIALGRREGGSVAIRLDPVP